MGISTWHNTMNLMPEAVDKGYKSKDSRQRAKQEVKEVWENRIEFCRTVNQELATGAYLIGEYRHFWLTDRKKQRYISVLPFRDRCVQNGTKMAIEPVILRQITGDMLGGLPERGILANQCRYCVIRRMQRIMGNKQLTHYIQGDISKFYDNVDNVVAMRIIEQHIKDHRTLALIRQHLFKQKRLAIGDPFSHLIANLVMSRLVRHLKATYGRRIHIVNFADDIFIASHCRKILLEVMRDMRTFVKRELRLHYKRLYIRPLDTAEPIIFCGNKYTRKSVLLTQKTKKRYIRSRHKRRSMGSYNGILEKCDSKHLRYLVEHNNNKHMGDKIRRPGAGTVKKIDEMVGVKHTIVNFWLKASKQKDCDHYYHVQAISEEFGLIVYSTGSSKICDYLSTKSEHDLPLRDLVIVRDWSGFYYEGTVYTDDEEEALIREQYGI